MSSNPDKPLTRSEAFTRLLTFKRVRNIPLAVWRSAGWSTASWKRAQARPPAKADADLARVKAAIIEWRRNPVEPPDLPGVEES